MTASISSTSSRYHAKQSSYHALKRQRTAIDADIPHLLDPSYASSSSSSPHSSPLSSIYVDREGRVHDPAYRMFATPSTSSQKQRRRVRQARSGQLSETDSEDEDDDQVYSRPRSSFESRRGSFEVPRRQPSITFPYSSATSTTSSTFPSYFPRDPSSPFTFDDDVLEEDDEDAVPTKHKKTKSRRGSRTYPSFDADDAALATVSPVDEDDTASSPSCMYALRLHWQSLNMRVRFGLFRTKKSIRRRVAPHPAILAF